MEMFVFLIVVTIINSDHTVHFNYVPCTVPSSASMKLIKKKAKNKRKIILKRKKHKKRNSEDQRICTTN